MVHENDEIGWPNVVRNYAIFVPVGHGDDAIRFGAFDAMPIGAPISDLYDRSAHLWGQLLGKVRETQVEGGA